MSTAAADITYLQRQVLAQLADGGVSGASIALALGRSDRTVQRALDDLRRRGLVTHNGQCGTASCWYPVEDPEHSWAGLADELDLWAERALAQEDGEVYARLRQASTAVRIRLAGIAPSSAVQDAESAA